MPRNPSELQRLIEEREDLLSRLKSPVLISKGGKNYLLRELREIEAQLGIESIPYNSSEFGK